MLELTPNAASFLAILCAVGPIATLLAIIFPIALMRFLVYLGWARGFTDWRINGDLSDGL
jgi:hypothetical protein